MNYDFTAGMCDLPRETLAIWIGWLFSIVEDDFIIRFAVSPLVISPKCVRHPLANFGVLAPDCGKCFALSSISRHHRSSAKEWMTIIRRSEMFPYHPRELGAGLHTALQSPGCVRSSGLTECSRTDRPLACSRWSWDCRYQQSVSRASSRILRHPWPMI